MEERIEGVWGENGNGHYIRKGRVKGKQCSDGEIEDQVYYKLTSGFVIYIPSHGASSCSSNFSVPVPGLAPEANHAMCLFDFSQLPFTESLYHFYHNGLAKAKRRRSLHHKQQLERDSRVSFPGNIPFNFCYHIWAHWVGSKRG